MGDAAGLIYQSSWIGSGYRELHRLNGNGTSLSFLNDASDQDIGYDVVKRLVRLRAFLPDGATAFLDREYTYNRANMRTSERRHDDHELTDAFDYDSLYRVVTSAYDMGTEPTAVPRDNLQTDYAYDGVGNRRSQTDQSQIQGQQDTTYAVNNMNEYTAIGLAMRHHSDNGNLTDDGTRTFQYDYRNRMVAVSDKTKGNLIAQYSYLADNRRVEKAVYDESGSLEKVTEYSYDGWKVCEESDGATGLLEMGFVWSPVYIDELVQIEQTPNHAVGSATLYAHQNARADIVSLTDSSGAVVEQRYFDDFGRAYDEAKQPVRMSGVGCPYGFQGRRLDPETGFYYFRNRYYDPAAGRFLQRDHVWDPGNVGNQINMRLSETGLFRGETVSAINVKAFTKFRR